jgi:hypothetical protein
MWWSRKLISSRKRKSFLRVAKQFSNVQGIKYLVGMCNMTFSQIRPDYEDLTLGHTSSGLPEDFWRTFEGLCQEMQYFLKTIPVRIPWGVCGLVPKNSLWIHQESLRHQEYLRIPQNFEELKEKSMCLQQDLNPWTTTNHMILSDDTTS